MNALYHNEPSSYRVVPVNTKYHNYITYSNNRASGDLILGFKNRFITILQSVYFTHESFHEVARLGLEIIGLRLIYTKYINFLMTFICDLHTLLLSGDF